MSFLYMSSMLIISLSILFTQTSHPLALGLTLLTQTLIVCGATSLLTKTVWFSYMLFLIFLGAMLVLFIYVASLAPNEPFSISTTLTVFILLPPMMGLTFLFLDPTAFAFLTASENSFLTTEIPTNTLQTLLSTIYNPHSVNLTLFIILYLLLTLIVVVKISSTHSGALRLN